MHALEKEVAIHSSVLAWRIPGTEDPGGLPSMGSHRVRHNWSDLAAAAGAAGSGCVERHLGPPARTWGRPVFHILTYKAQMPLAYPRIQENTLSDPISSPGDLINHWSKSWDSWKTCYIFGNICLNWYFPLHVPISFCGICLQCS